MNFQTYSVWAIGPANESSIPLADTPEVTEMKAVAYTILFATLVLSLCILAVWRRIGRPTRFPPGPKVLLFSKNHYLFALDNVDFSTRLQWMSEHYGQFISLRLSARNQWDVFVFNPDVIGDVLRNDKRFEMRKNFDWNHRVCVGGFKPREELARHGIACLMDAFETGCAFTITRKGENGLANVLKDEITELTRRINPTCGTRMVPKHFLSKLIISIMSRLLFNSTFDLDSEELDLHKLHLVAYSRYCKPTHRQLERGNRFLYPSYHTDRLIFAASQHFLTESVHSLIDLRDPRGELDERVSLMGMLTMANYWVPDVEATRSTMATEPPVRRQEPVCVADYVWGRLLDDFGIAVELPEKPVVSMFLDLLTEAEDDVSEVLNWAILKMLNNSDVAFEVYMELRSAFPNKNHVIQSDDRRYLPYTRATLEEVLRGLPKTYSTYNLFAAEDIDDFHGYRIPEGTRIVPHMKTIFDDARIWMNFYEFNPHNHLLASFDSSSDSEGTNVRGRYRTRRSRLNVTFRESDFTRMTTRRVGQTKIPAGHPRSSNAVLPSQKMLHDILFTVFANLMRRFKFSAGSVPKMSYLDNGAYYPLTPLFKCNIQRRLR